uniref:Uncharacterized protein n=1 Tax=Populus trichocarpa TaxID=3694 RepID=A0A2K1ZCT9_POPTR
MRYWTLGNSCIYLGVCTLHQTKTSLRKLSELKFSVSLPLLYSNGSILFKSLLQCRLNLDDCKIHILVYASFMFVLS